LALAVYCCCPVLLVHFLVGLWYSSLLLPFALLNGSLFPSLHFLCTARGLYMLLLNRLGVVPLFWELSFAVGWMSVGPICLLVFVNCCLLLCWMLLSSAWLMHIDFGLCGLRTAHDGCS